MNEEIIILFKDSNFTKTGDLHVNVSDVVDDDDDDDDRL